MRGGGAGGMGRKTGGDGGVLFYTWMAWALGFSTRWAVKLVQGEITDGGRGGERG